MPYRFPCVLQLVLLCLWSPLLHAQRTGPDWNSSNESELLKQAIPFYHQHIEKADSISAIRMLDELIRTGRKERKAAQEAIAYGMKAGYLWSRNPDDSAATALYLRAWALAQKKGMPVLSAYFEYALGSALYFGNAQARGIEYLLSAREHVQDIGVNRFPAAGPLFYALGTVYCDYGEWNKSLEYLRRATRFPFADSHMLYRLYGMFGVIHYRLRQGDSSIYYSKQALAVAVAIKDTAEIASMSGNIGAGYVEMKAYDTGMAYLQRDFRISSSRGNWSSAAASLNAMTRIYLEQNDPDQALRIINRIDSIYSFCACNSNEARRAIYQTLSEIYKKKGDHGKTVMYLDSFIYYNSLYTEKYSRSLLKSAELKIVTESHETRMKLLESERKRAILLRNGLIIASVLVIIIIAQVLYRMRQRQISERRIFALQLRNAEKQLASYVESIREKNRLTEMLTEELDRLRFDPHNPDHADTAEKEQILERIRKASLITEEGWLEFTQLVNAVHKHFFIRLKQKYPDLSAAETRLLTLTKLNFSTREMVDMLGISPDSVKKARQRVRKKIGLSSEDDLSDAVAQL